MKDELLILAQKYAISKCALYFMKQGEIEMSDKISGYLNNHEFKADPESE